MAPRAAAEGWGIRWLGTRKGISMSVIIKMKRCDLPPDVETTGPFKPSTQFLRVEVGSAFGAVWFSTTTDFR